MSSAWILFVAGKVQEGEVTSRAAPFPTAPRCPQEHSAPSPQEVWGRRLLPGGAGWEQRGSGGEQRPPCRGKMQPWATREAGSKQGTGCKVFALWLVDKSAVLGREAKKADAGVSARRGPEQGDGKEHQGASAVEEQLSLTSASSASSPAKRGRWLEGGCREGWLVFPKTPLMNSSCTSRRCRDLERLNGT